MTPLVYYHKQCELGVISEDSNQLICMQHLQQVYEHLIIENQRRSNLMALFRQPRLVKGLYIWGGVGIGKTFMMDCFFHSLPFSNKMRMHFYQFMQQIHNALTQYQGEKDPLQKIARELARKTAVLCFDEFFVSDITDAMLLGRLFKTLFAEGVCLVLTSNISPDDLYKNGLQRRQFLPTIALLKQNTDIVHLPSTIDYRLRYLKEAGVFYTPLNDETQQSMENTFAVLTNGEMVDDVPITIFGREIKVKKKTASVIWFDFSEICSVPRSQKDYLAITEQYHTVFISDITAINANEKDKICLFISLVDVLYNARIRLVISAALPVQQLYNCGYMVLEYTRTHSRLLEMQTTDYFASEVISKFPE